MNIEELKKLLNKFKSGDTTLDEELKLREYFQSDNVTDKLKPYADQFNYYCEMRNIKPSDSVDPFAKIDFEPGVAVHHSPTYWMLRIAAGFALLLVGFAAGYFMEFQQADEQQFASYQNEITQMKSALLFNPNRQATASERIAAVNISAEIPASANLQNSEITEILIHTMNTDDNINVRLAAAEALFRFRDEPRVQTALVNSLQIQQNPMLQITLINMLVRMKQKNAIGEMQQMLVEADLQPIVKERLQLGINLLRSPAGAPGGGSG